MQWNGFWEKRDERIICQWMIVWQQIGDSYFGCIGGYSGGGSFQLEKYVVKDGNCWLDSDIQWLDLIKTEVEVDLVETSMDQILEFHDDDLWLETDNLVLCNEEIISKISSKEITIGSDIPLDLKKVFEKTGLTSSPIF